MKLGYSVKLEDIVIFNRDHIDASPALRRKILIMRMVWAFTPLLTIFLIMNIEGATPDKIMKVVSLVAVFFTAPVFLFQPAFHRWSCARQIRKMYEQGQNQGLLGEHEMQIVGHNLVEKNEINESTAPLASIEKIISADAHTYIYTGPAQAHVIPKNSILSGEYDQFIDEVKRRAGKVK